MKLKPIVQMAGFFASASILTACVAAGSGGELKNGDITAYCGNGCASYAADGKSCATFHGSATATCSTYFKELCSVQNCKNDANGNALPLGTR